MVMVIHKGLAESSTTSKHQNLYTLENLSPLSQGNVGTHILY